MAAPRGTTCGIYFCKDQEEYPMATNYFEGAVKTEEGLQFNGFTLLPIDEKCNGCDRIAEYEGEKYCMSYPEPSKKWAHGACNFATHVKASVDKGGKVKINPLKASKRAARNR